MTRFLMAVFYAALAFFGFRALRSEPEEEEPVIQYNHSLHEKIKAMYETAEQIELVREMMININTADAPSQGDALRTMDIYWDWCGKLEQQASFPISKGTATAEALHHVAEVREEELMRELTRQIMALPRPEISDKK